MKQHAEMGTKDLVSCCQLSRRLLISRSVSGQEEYRGPLAQLAEQGTLNAQVGGSSPPRLTRKASTDVLGQNNHPHPPLKDKPKQPHSTDLPRRYFVILDTDGADETILDRDDAYQTLPVINPLARPETIVIPNRANEVLLSFTAPSTPREYVAEVAP